MGIPITIGSRRYKDVLVRLLLVVGVVRVVPRSVLVETTNGEDVVGIEGWCGAFERSVVFVVVVVVVVLVWAERIRCNS